MFNILTEEPISSSSVKLPLYIFLYRKFFDYIKIK